MTQRRDRRFGTRLPVRLSITTKLGGLTKTFYSNDVGPEGVFLTMNKPPNPHHLVHMTMTLPPEGEKIRLRGLVVRTISQIEAVTRGLVPGVGVHIYGSGEKTRRIWYQFIEQAHRELEDTYKTYTPIPTPVSPDEEETSSGLSTGPLTPPAGHVWTPLPSGLLTPLPENVNAPTKKRLLTPTPAELALGVSRMLEQSRHMLFHPPRLFHITPPTIAEMARFHTDALSVEGIVLTTRRPQTAADELAVVSVAHPVTGAEFHVPGRVISRSKAFHQSTVIQFLGVTKLTTANFEVFMASGTPPVMESTPENAVDEKVIYEDAHETQGDMGNNPLWFEPVDEYLPVTSKYGSQGDS